MGGSEGIAPYILNLYSIGLNAQFHAAATLTPRNTYPMPLGWEILLIRTRQLTFRMHRSLGLVVQP